MEGVNVFIVDDFMKGGGIINGMKILIEEFDVNLIGIIVFVEVSFVGNCLIDDYMLLL